MDILRHIFAPALLLAALLCAPACEGQKDDAGEGTGTLIVNISNPVELETRHASGEGSDASDGGIMKTLGVWLITDGQANGDWKYTILQRDLSTPNAATATVTFDDVARGNYFLVIAANYGQTTMDVDDYGPNTSVNEAFTASYVTTQINGSYVSTLSDGQSPEFNDTMGMPSSFEKTFSVAAGVNVIDASLRRCVGRLTFNVRNNLDNYELFIHSLGLSKHNRSQGKVFESEGVAGEYIEFPDLPDMDQDGDGVKDGLVQVGPREVKNVYDIYLFETNPADSIQFNMLAALYPKDTQKSAVTVASRAQETYEFAIQTQAFTAGGTYLIRSKTSSTYYLGDDGSGNLVATSFTDDDNIKNASNIKNYFWTFSSNSGTNNKSTSTTIKNLGTGKYLAINSSGVSLSDSSSEINNKASLNDGLRFWGDNDSNIAFDGSSISVTRSYRSNSNVLWYVRKVTGGTSDGTVDYFVNPTKEISRVTRPIKYIDNYGASQLLTKISRNEHVTVNVNVFYNRELGEFQFEVLDWNDGGEHQTTFD
jgi:hypothetical protein